MKVYKVKVNGKVYEVELESVSESAAHIEAPVQATATEQVAPQPVVSGEGAPLKAPMAGTILDVKVSVGQTVQVGQTICILEAMKLENEVVATESGVVKEIVVSAGAMVANKDALIILG